jgi:hypothetical protein
MKERTGRPADYAVTEKEGMTIYFVAKVQFCQIRQTIPTIPFDDVCSLEMQAGGGDELTILSGIERENETRRVAIFSQQQQQTNKQLSIGNVHDGLGMGGGGSNSMCFIITRKGASDSYGASKLGLLSWEVCRRSLAQAFWSTMPFKAIQGPCTDKEANRPLA